MCIFFQTIHPVEFPEGNPIQQGRLGSLFCLLIAAAPGLRLVEPTPRRAGGPPWCDRDLLTCHCCYGLASATGF